MWVWDREWDGSVRQRNKQNDEGWSECDRSKERVRQVMAHFTQHTKEITGGLEAWHGRHGDVSANKQMQKCHLRLNWGQGRMRNTDRTQIKMISNEAGSVQRRDKKAVIWSCWVHTLAEWAQQQFVIACGTRWTFEVSCLVTVLLPHTDHCATDRPGPSVMIPSHMSYSICVELQWPYLGLGVLRQSSSSIRVTLSEHITCHIYA